MGAKLQLVKPTEGPRAAIIDEYGELKRQEAAFQPTADRLKYLRSVIAGWIPDTHPAEEGIEFHGLRYEVHATARANERRVANLAKILKFLGREKFFSVCRVAVGALEEALGKAAAAPWFVSERTGPRTISAVAKASPAARKAA
jgi:hypothetical protein